MRLTEFETALLAGEHGEPRQFAMMQQVKVGEFFDSEDMVAVSQVHLMADTESLGEAGVVFLEKLAAASEADRRVAVPTVTDPRGIDLAAYKQLNQAEGFAELERRAIAAFSTLGVMLTDTCINYQTIMPPVLGEHLAFGDTGSAIYANSVCGARSNFEGGPAALAAALTGRVPRYGYHLDRHRRGSRLFTLADRPATLSDWGAVGGIVGRELESYWEVPVIDGVKMAPTSDELKHFGAALASFGSVAMFHMVGVTPEAPDLATAFDGPPPPAQTIARADIDSFYASYGVTDDRVDVVVFAAPQLSLFEMRQLATLLDGRKVHAGTALLAATSPEIKLACDRFGLTRTIEDAGGTVLSGVCFYQMYARETGEANGWQRLLTNSAKLVNIIAGYGYEPVLAPMARCVESAVAGRIVG
jgi:predicted aconitase